MREAGDTKPGFHFPSIRATLAANSPEEEMTIAELIYEQVKKLPDQAARSA